MHQVLEVVCIAVCLMLRLERRSCSKCAVKQHLVNEGMQHSAKLISAQHQTHSKYTTTRRGQEKTFTQHALQQRTLHISQERQHSLRSVAEPPVPSLAPCALHCRCRMAPQPQHCSLCHCEAPPVGKVHLQAATAKRAKTRPTPPPPAGLARAQCAQQSCSVLACRRCSTTALVASFPILSCPIHWAQAQ